MVFRRGNTSLMLLLVYEKLPALRGTEITFEHGRMCGQMAAFPRILNNKSWTAD